MEESLRLYETIDGFRPEASARLAVWYGAKELMAQEIRSFLDNTKHGGN